MKRAVPLLAACAAALIAASAAVAAAPPTLRCSVGPGHTIRLAVKPR